MNQPHFHAIVARNAKRISVSFNKNIIDLQIARVSSTAWRTPPSIQMCVLENTTVLVTHRRTHAQPENRTKKKRNYNRSSKA